MKYCAVGGFWEWNQVQLYIYIYGGKSETMEIKYRLTINVFECGAGGSYWNAQDFVRTSLEFKK